MVSVVWDDDEGRATRATAPQIVWDDARNKDDLDQGPDGLAGASVVWDAPRSRGDVTAQEQRRQTGAEFDLPGPSALEQAAQYNQSVRNSSSIREALGIENPLATAVIGAVDGAPIPRKAGNINLGRVNAADETKNVLVETAETTPAAMEAARRGVISHAETQKLAETMGLSAEQLLKRRKGQAFNAEEALAARQTLITSATDLIGLAKVAKGGSEEAKFAFKAALAKHEALQAQVSGMTAEAGRALSQFNIPVEGASREYAIRRILEGDRDKFEAIADLMSQLDDPQAAARFAARAQKATTFDKIYEVWINALLSGPQTHAVNTLSNALVALWTIPEQAIAAGISAARRAPAGERVYFRESTAKLFGFVEGGKDGLRYAWKALKSGDPQFGTVNKIEQQRMKAVPGTAGEVIRTPTRFLTAEDDLFKAIGYRMELNAQAMRSGLDQGLSGQALAQHIKDTIANPPDGLKLRAIKAADYQTFNKELGAAGSAAMRAIHSMPAARVIMPFVRTPSNILKFAGERAPFLSLLMKDVREALKRGGPDGDIALARIALGSTVGATVASLAMEGLVTGGGPADPRERSLLYATGWRPYSIRVGDKYYAYQRLEPLGMLLGVSADFTEAAGYMGQAEADEIGAMIVGSISQNLVSKTWLSGLAGLLNAIESPEQYGPQYVQGLAGTVIPTGVAQLSKVADPILRDTQSLMDRIKTRIPGYSKTLPPRRNLFGEPITLTGGLGPDLVSPIYTGQRTGNKAAEEMVRLRMTPGLPQREIAGVALTPEQYSEYVWLAGRHLQSTVEIIMTTRQYQSLNDENRVRFIEKTIRRLREDAREQMLDRHKELAALSGERKEQQGDSRNALEQLDELVATQGE
jgi:hypothetical protein